MDVWLCLHEVRKLENLTDRAIRWRIQNGMYTKIRRVKSAKGGRGGVEWQIHISSLSPAAQALYFKELAQKGGARAAEESAEKKLKASLEFASASPIAQARALARAELIRALEERIEKLQEQGENRVQSLAAILEAYAARTWDPTVALPEGEKPIFDLLREVSIPTFYRWKKAFEVRGLDGLLPRRRFSSIKFADDIRREIEKLIWERSRKGGQIWRILKAAFPDRKDFPCKRTVQRYVKKYKAEHREALALALEGESAWRHKFQVALGNASEKAKEPNDYWEIDTTPADLLCKDGRRYKVIGLLDVYSRRAICRIWPTSNGWAIAQTLRAAILAWGIPRHLIRDNGRDYQSRLVDQVCAELGIETPPIPYRRPDLKPHVERFFRTLSENFFSELTGFTGNNLLTRPEVIRLNYEPEEVQGLMDKWIASAYEEEVHRSLGKRPREAFQKPGWQPRVVADERQLDLLLMPARTMRVRQGAIRRTIHGQELVYYHPALLDYNGQYLQVRVDMMDASRIHVWDARGYLCEAREVAAAGLTVQEIVDAQKKRKKAIKEMIRAQREALEDGPVDRNFKRYLEYKEKMKPAILPPKGERVEVGPPIAADLDFQDMEETPPAPPEREAPAQIIALPDPSRDPSCVPDPDWEPVFWEGDDPFFIDGWRKYVWIHKERLWKGLPICEATQKWKEEYEKTREYELMFVKYDALQPYRWMAKKASEGGGGE